MGPDRHVVDEGAAARHAVDIAGVDFEAGFVAARRRWRRRFAVGHVDAYPGLLAGQEVAIVRQRRVVRGYLDRSRAWAQ
jgi:hypothetical protein